MSFRCLSCGHKGKKALQGACPACGSFNLKRADTQKLEPEKPQASQKLKSLAMTVLWLCLGYLIFQKLFGA